MLVLVWNNSGNSSDDERHPTLVGSERHSAFFDLFFGLRVVDNRRTQSTRALRARFGTEIGGD